MSELARPAAATRPRYAAIARAGLIAAAVAAVLNVVAALLVAALLDAPADYGPLQPAPVVASTVLAVLLGTAAYAWLARVPGRAERLFPRIAWAVAGASLLQPLSLLTTHLPVIEGEGGATLRIVLGTMVLHLIPAAVVTRLLPRSRA